MTSRGGPIIRAPVPGRYQLQHGGASMAYTAVSGSGATHINEQWRQGTLDTTNLWTSAVTATGTNGITRNSVPIPYLLQNCVAGSDTERITSQPVLVNPSSITLANTIWQRLVLEFTLRLVTVANLDNTACTWGLSGTDASATGRSGTNQFTFILASDALNILSDLSGTETVTVVSPAPTLTNWNKLRIVVENAQILAYVNEVLQVTQTTNLPANSFQVQFYTAAEAGGAAAAHIGPVRCWTEDREDGL